MKSLRTAAPALALVLGLALPGLAHAASATRTSAFDYDPASGLLVREILEPDTPALRLETAYTYDAYGNRSAATVSSPATGSAAIAARTSSTAYDPRGQFPLSSSNALGHSESKTLDPRFGAVTRLTGPNGLTTQWQYDSLGRQTLEIRADGTRTRWDYQYCNGINGGTAACPGLAAYLVQVTPLAADGVTANGPWSKTYYDALERVIRTETVGFDGSSVIVQSTEYDNLGRVARASAPYFSGQAPHWTSFTYDALGRVLATTLPDNTQSSAAYNGMTSSVTNALGQTTTSRKNSQGQTVQVTDAAGNNLTYQYDPFGNLTQTTDPKGNTVTLGYDLRGRKIRMLDPDMGSWSYDYDALGQLVRQTDAKNQVTTLSYDPLGRLTRRAEPDLVSTWSYDNCAQGIGKLCQSSTDNGYRQVTSYDSLGRAAGTVTTLDTSYTASVSYDGNGRIARRTYPTGLAIQYVYTSLGYLKEVRNAAGNALIWRADSMDAQGHLLQHTYGNAIVTQQSFDPATGRLLSIMAGAGNGVQNLSLSYDALGRLVSRSDATQHLNETFLYDKLNRLTSATVNSGGAGVVTQSFTYDSIGNIVSRSDLGNYSYGAVNNRPHALTQLVLNAGGKRSYAYDANGNLTSETQYDAANNVIATKGRSEVYTSFNLPQALGAPGISLAFAYGPEHQRVKQIAPGATTLYLHPDNSGGLFYEKDLKPDGGIEHRHFITAGAGVVAIVKQSGSSTTVVYLHRDQLGSTTAVTDEAGAVLERLAYEPFGKRRTPAGQADPDNTIAGINTDRGYTNHEHLDELGLIHMNGRIYDPALGRFMSADPYIQAPGNSQSYNRYAYVMNSPFLYTDPSGYLFGGMFKVPFIDNAWNNHIKPAGRQILSVGAVAACTYFTAGAGTAACVGASQAAISKGYGASWNQALRSGAVAGATAYAFNWVGDNYPGYGQSGATSATIFQNTVGHAVVGCGAAWAGGGNCGAGAMAGGFSAAYGNYVGYSNNAVFATVQSAVVGGTASVLGGGKFENGAVTGAFGYLFNCYMHECWKDLRAGTCTSPTIACSQQNARYQEAYDTIAKGQALESDHPELFFVGGMQVNGAKLGLTELMSYGVANTGRSAGEGLISMSMGAGRVAANDFAALAANYGATINSITTNAGQVIQRFSVGDATVILRNFGNTAGTTIQVTAKGILDGIKLRYP